jgi:hypothetical protein
MRMCGCVENDRVRVAAIANTPFGMDYPPGFGKRLDSTDVPVTAEPNVLCSFRASIVARGLARVFRSVGTGHQASLP